MLSEQSSSEINLTVVNNAKETVDPLKALMLRGISDHRAGRLSKAQSAYEEIVSKDPDNFHALQLLASTYNTQERFGKAAHFFDRALVLCDSNAQVLSNCASNLRSLGQFNLALECLNKALALDPDFAVAHFNRANLFRETGQYSEAIYSYNTAVLLDPNYAESFNNLGNTLRDLGRLHEALIVYVKALLLRPKHGPAHNNVATTFHSLGDLVEARASYDAGLLEAPGCSDLKFNKSLLLLLSGDYQGGWELYESRLEMDDLKKKLPAFDEPRWDGCEDIIGKRLFIHEEQGLGDLIHFCRYVPALIDKGVEVFLETPKALAPLLKTLHPKVRLVLTGARPPDFDFYCPLMSLPFAAKTTLDTISGAAYLSSDKARVAQWKARIGESKAAQIGLVWSGNSAHRNDHHRSIELQDLLPILDKSHDWHSLQKEYRPNDIDVMECQTKIIQHQDELSDFADTAALIENLDLVITVDTSVAHLAGSLGKPVWILLPKVPDYRWMLDRSDTPWYRSARLYRQSALGDWTDVLEKVAGDIRKVTTDV